MRRAIPRAQRNCWNRQTKKIDAVRSELSLLASQPAGPEKDAALDSIDAKFGAWADDFVRNKERTRLEVEQMDAEKVKKQLDDAAASARRQVEERKSINDKFHSLFSFAVGAIGKAIHAYNAKSGSRFTVDLPAVPYDLYDKSSAGYKGTVNFEGKATWTVSIGVPDSMYTQYGENNYPSMGLSIEQDNARIGSVSIGGVYNGPGVAVSFGSGALPRLSEIDFHAPADDYQAKLVRSMQRLVEAQVYTFK